MPAATNHRLALATPDNRRASRLKTSSDVPSDTVFPTRTANDGLSTSRSPYFVPMWPMARISDAPSGNAMAHKGQVRPNACGFHAATIAPATTAEVPTAIAGDSCSPSNRMAKAVPKIGVTAVSVLVSVGPIILMLEIASVVESAGRMMPTMANMSAAVVAQYELLTKHGANNQ